MDYFSRGRRLIRQRVKIGLHDVSTDTTTTKSAFRAMKLLNTIFQFFDTLTAKEIIDIVAGFIPFCKTDNLSDSQLKVFCKFLVRPESCYIIYRAVAGHRVHINRSTNGLRHIAQNWSVNSISFSIIPDANWDNAITDLVILRPPIALYILLSWVSVVRHRQTTTTLSAIFLVIGRAHNYGVTGVLLLVNGLLLNSIRLSDLYK